MESRDLTVALKKLRIRLGALRYEDAKRNLSAPVSMLEGGLPAAQIIEILAVNAPTTTAKFSPADYRAAKFSFLKALHEIRQIIDLA